MDFESVVMYRLAAEGLFLSPQFSIRDDSGGEWCCPDFVALDFGKRQVQVVEVTTASDVANLIEKIKKREQQWFQKLRSQLLRRGVIQDSWSFIVRAFVRQQHVKAIVSNVDGAEDVVVEAIEKVTFAWEWPWDQFPKV